jgi:signal transduction histidine kinase
MRLLSLRTKFILAFLAAALASIALVGVFTAVFSNQRFNNLVIEQRTEDITQIIQDHYQEQGSLQGIEMILRPRPDPLSPEMEPLFPPGFLLADLQKRVILGDENHPKGSQLPPPEVAVVEPIQSEGTTIAYLAIINPAARPSPREQEFIRQANTALLYASLGALVLSVVLGLIFTQSLLKPLSTLNQAIKKMQEGEWGQEITPTSDDELGQVIRTFNQMSQAVAEAKTRREQLTADIAHELRSPLTVVNGYLEALQDGSLAPTTERINTIRQEVEQMNRLVSDLRTLALADAGQLSIIKAPVEIGEIFKRLENAYSLRARAKGIALKSEIQSPDRVIQVDEGRMIQALGNLVSNALRHTAEDGQIILSADRSQETVQISVRDTGSGIQEKDLPYLFERFYRADSSRYTTDGETGLGLSIVKAIIEAHGGEIQVQSQVGEGTTFTILLPAFEDNSRRPIV